MQVENGLYVAKYPTVVLLGDEIQPEHRVVEDLEEMQSNYN